MNSEGRGTEVTVPHLAESLVSATVGKWLKQPGDYVREYDILCELMTDKVNVEMPSPLEGTLLRILVSEGESADVGAPICVIREPGAPRASAEAAAESANAGEGAMIGRVSIVGKAAVTAAESNRQARFSPAVLHLAKVHRVDLSKIRGTGMGGRITRRDVLAFVQEGKAAPVVVSTKPAPGPEPKERASAVQERGGPESEAIGKSAGSGVIPRGAGNSGNVGSANYGRTGISGGDVYAGSPGGSDDQLLPITPIRNTIASRMKQSVAEIPHAWMMIEADVSNLVALRQKLKDRFMSKEGVPLTYIPFVLKAIVNAIKEFPLLNSSWVSDKIAVKKEIHLSVAVGSEESVVTPVLRNADRKTIAGLAIELDDLVKRARSGKLTVADMQGGTFTFNNTGSFGSVLSKPIINYPQAAIITFESIVRRPVVIQGDAIAIRSMANLCLSLDHRILDGVICGRFLQRVKHYLEHYDPDSVIY